MNAKNIIEEAETTHEKIKPHIRECAKVFHNNEGELFTRAEAISLLEDEVNIDSTTAAQALSQLVGDIVDPIIQVNYNAKKYVGVVEFNEFDGAYGYIDYDDMYGGGKRVVCQQCVNTASEDSEVTHATENDPHGSFGGDATWEELVEAIHSHYEDSHSSMPGTIKTGATLASGTTIGGNTSFHKGNDGLGSDLVLGRVEVVESLSDASNLSTGSVVLVEEENSVFVEDGT